MNSSTSEPGGAFAHPEAFVGLTAGGESIPGVASLDSPALQQTKSEIRSLAGELAQLAHTALEPADFYEGFLPRLCAAMGAKGAGVWRINSNGKPYLIAGHSLPTALLAAASNSTSDTTSEPTSETSQARTSMASVSDEFDLHRPSVTRPSEPHQRILQCVVAEGQPILVPPGNVKLETERPTNPLSEALIIIPIRPQENVEFLLEVVQRPSGGPAAQRGYLRFVAQMGDLMADYLRRQQLREMSGERQRLERIEGWLTAIATAPATPQRQQLVSDATLELLNAERVFLLDGRGRVVAISGTRNFDPRSEVVLAAQTVHSQYRQLHTRPSGPSSAGVEPIWFQATDRRQKSADSTADEKSQRIPPSGIDRLCEASACRQGVWVPLGESNYWSALLTYSEESVAPQREINDEGTPQFRLLRSIGAMLEGSSGGTGWLAYTGLQSLRDWLTGDRKQRSAKASSLQLVQLWLLRAALVGLVLAIAFFPVSQPVSATAILQPHSKQMYYAPAAGIVAEVIVDEGDIVDSGTPLMRLTSHELETQAENLQIELKKTRGQLAEKTSRLHRGETLSALEKDQLEFDLRDLETELQSLELQRADTSDRLNELTIVARRTGTISTWDLRNRLLNHPVQAGQLLASTFDPDDKWRLELSIPDYRVGLVADALASAPQGAVQVSFSLASHPDQILEAFAVGMAPQVTVQNDAASARVVKTEAFIRDPNVLPLKKDGAIARATIDCGKVPLAWLVFRDAYWAVSSRVRMLW